LKQGDALSPLLFNKALEKVRRCIKNNKRETNIGAAQINVLRFADDLNRVGDIMEVVAQNISTFIEGGKINWFKN